MNAERTIRRILLALAAGAGAAAALGKALFHLMTDMKKTAERDRTKETKKKRMLKQMEINHPRHSYAEEYEEARAWCEARPMRDWYIRSREGLRLHASYLPAEAGNEKRFVVLCHGYKGSRFGSVAGIARYLHENHCSLLFIDQRCCGKSEGRYVTFGAREQYDLLSWLKRLRKENKKRLPVYLYGQSMGAAAVLLAAGHPLPGEVRGLIADCGFHSMKQQFQNMAADWFHIRSAGILRRRVELFCRLYAGFSLKETDTTEALRKNTRPVLFFHGELDTYVRPEASRQNYELCAAPKELVLIPGARHLCSYYAQPELYKQKISDFFQKYDKPPA